MDLDASVVFTASDKENAAATYKGGTGFCPNLAICDNVGDVLGIDPRPGNATSNCAADNIKLLEAAVTALPGRYRHRRWSVSTGPAPPTACQALAIRSTKDRITHEKNGTRVFDTPYWIGRGLAVGDHVAVIL